MLTVGEGIVRVHRHAIGDVRGSIGRMGELADWLVVDEEGSVHECEYGR